jgi:hypothetical protein
MALLAKYIRIDHKTNGEALEEAYEFMRRATEKRPYPNVDGLRAQIEMIAETDAKAKNARMEQLLDLSILEELDKSGFIDSLYKQAPQVKR